MADWDLILRTDVCDNNLPSFFADLALIYHNPNEVMRILAIFTEKKLNFFVTIT